jgi:hypothetical protein
MRPRTMRSRASSGMGLPSTRTSFSRTRSTAVRAPSCKVAILRSVIPTHLCAQLFQHLAHRNQRDAVFHHRRDIEGNRRGVHHDLKLRHACRQPHAIFEAHQRARCAGGGVGCGGRGRRVGDLRRTEFLPAHLRRRLHTAQFTRHLGRRRRRCENARLLLGRNRAARTGLRGGGPVHRRRKRRLGKRGRNTRLGRNFGGRFGRAQPSRFAGACLRRSSRS